MQTTTDKDNGAEHRFEEGERNGVYRAIYTRRDVRSQFTDRPISNEVLQRLLMAAHHAPSVGFMQPWNFIVIRSDDVKQKVHKAFKKANAREASMFDPQRRESYVDFKLEGIRESPINLCVTCDRSRHGPVVIGRTSSKVTDLYSTVCAVQNLWLAARAEGIGVGWVSILNVAELKKTLAIPNGVVPVAYLCIGHVDHFSPAPELEMAGWLDRLPLNDLIFSEQWGQTPDAIAEDDSTCSHFSIPQIVSDEPDRPSNGKAHRTKRISLIRHASVAENRQHRFIGSTDPKLTDEGQQEAQRLSTLLSNQDFDRVWCSPLHRTRQTLDAIQSQSAPAAELPEAESLDDLREIDFGQWEGRTFDELSRDDPQLVAQWEKDGEAFAFPGGEVIADFRVRVDRILKRIASDDADSFVLVTHGGVIRHLICRYLGYSMSRSLTFQVAPASVTTLEVHGDDAMLTALNVQPLGDG